MIMIGLANQLCFFVRAIIGLIISLNETISLNRMIGLAIDEAILTKTDFAVGFSRLSL